MKKIKILMVLIATTAYTGMSAQVAINTDGTGIDNSAMLHLKSTDKGLLIPRMTQAEIEAIAGPSDGLAVYNTDDSHFYIFDEADYKWKEIDIGTGTIYEGCGTVTDIDGNTYTTVIIGSQCWMAENLATTKYNDGTSIPQSPNVVLYYPPSTPGFSWYNNNAAYGSTYGALYNGYAVNTGNLCPTGWHVPTSTEWTVLTNYLGGSAVAGGKLKETGFTHWQSPNTGATNERGFTALPGGRFYYSQHWSPLYMYYEKEFSALHQDSRWWDRYINLYRKIRYNNGSVYSGSAIHFEGFSVRCLKD